MSLSLILSIIFVHWIADFVLQTDWQAKNKSSNFIALHAHVTTYTICLTFFAVYYTINIDETFPWKKWVLVNGALHLVTDYFTSRLNTYLWNKGRVHDFFVSVGFDQVIHYACLFGTLFFFGGVQ